MGSKFPAPKIPRPNESMKKHIGTSKCYKFDYYDHFLTGSPEATTSMRLFSKKRKIPNAVIYFCMIVCSVLLLGWQSGGNRITENDRKCIREGKFNESTFEPSSDLGSKFRISFADQEKTFEWTLLPKICNDPKTKILMIVFSKPYGLSRRMVLRETWMSANYSRIIQNSEMKAVFLIGRNPNSESQKMLEKEAELYEDIILTSIQETYVNLPYKSLSAMLFATQKCTNIKLIGKIDDDVIFYPDQLGENIQKKIINVDSASIYGLKHAEGVAVNHVEGTKWYIPYSSFQCDYFPAYMSGPLYFVTNVAARRILNITNFRKFISVEDILLTGLYSMDTGIELKSLDDMYYDRHMTSIRSNRQLLSWHGWEDDEKYRDVFFYMFDTRCDACKRFHLEQQTQ